MEFNARPNLVQLAFQTQECILITEPSLDLRSKFNGEQRKRNGVSTKHWSIRLIDRIRSRGREDLLCDAAVIRYSVGHQRSGHQRTVISGHNASSNYISPIYFLVSSSDEQKEASR